jgi:peptidoglycan hydrolase-like amidase
MKMAVTLLLLLASGMPAQTIDIGVFTLFRPTELRVESTSGSLLLTSGENSVTLEGRQSIDLHLSETGSSIHLAARDGSAADFILSIPGKIRRNFHGTLTVEPGARYLRPIVSMDLESAVASVVAAESRPRTPIEALKAQAVVARSYYLASPTRHDHFEFCDTTHCQFLREPPSIDSPAGRAAMETRGLAISYRGKTFAALYSASCGGQTRSLAEPGSGYPYFAVSCDYCRRMRRGVVEGHQFGMCQRGAAAMAAQGASAREILDHYYPSATVGQATAGALAKLH